MKSFTSQRCYYMCSLHVYAYHLFYISKLFPSNHWRDASAYSRLPAVCGGIPNWIKWKKFFIFDFWGVLSDVLMWLTEINLCINQRGLPSEGGFAVTAKRYQTIHSSEGLLALVVEFMAFNNNFLWRAVETENRGKGEEFKSETKLQRQLRSGCFLGKIIAST